jgi:hypothetical protein
MVIEVLNWGLSVASTPQSPDPVPATVAHRAAPAVGTITCDLTGHPCRPPSTTARCSCPRRYDHRPRPDRGAADHDPSERRFHREHRRRRQHRDGATAMTHPRNPPSGHVVPPSFRGRGTGTGADARGLQPHRAGMRRHLRRDLRPPGADAGPGRDRHAGAYQHHGRGGEDPARALRQAGHGPATSTSRTTPGSRRGTSTTSS